MRISEKISKLLEGASENDKNKLSNLGIATHYIKGKGTFLFRLVCEFIPEKQKEANSQDIVDEAENNIKKIVKKNNKMDRELRGLL